MSIATLMGALIVAAIIGIWQGELPPSSINYTYVEVLLKGAPDIPRAFKYSFEIPHNITLNYDKLKKFEEYIYKINETIFLYLGNYSFERLEGWVEDGEGSTIIMHLSRSGNREALIIKPEKRVEVYASLEDKEGTLRLIPVFRVLNPEEIAEIKGYVNIKDVRNISLILFPNKVVLNSTSDLKNGSKIAHVLIDRERRFNIRLDPELLKLPFPLKEGPYILVYGDMCEGGYKWLDINKIKGESIHVSLECNVIKEG